MILELLRLQHNYNIKLLRNNNINNNQKTKKERKN